MCQMVLFGIKKNDNIKDESIFEITKIEEKENGFKNDLKQYEFYCDGYGCCCGSVVGVYQNHEESFQKIKTLQLQNFEKQLESIECEIKDLGELWQNYRSELDPYITKNNLAVDNLEYVEEGDENYLKLMKIHEECISKIHEIYAKYEKCNEVDIRKWGIQTKIEEIKTNKTENAYDDIYHKISKILNLTNELIIYNYWQEDNKPKVLEKITEIKFKNLNINDLVHLKYNEAIRVFK